MYRKEKEKHKETKNYVVNRNFQASGPKKGGRLVKNVDKRMRKDQRNDKFKAKKNKGKKGGPALKAKVQKGGGRPKKWSADIAISFIMCQAISLNFLDRQTETWQD